MLFWFLICFLYIGLTVLVLIKFLNTAQDITELSLWLCEVGVKVFIFSHILVTSLNKVLFSRGL
jgi:hypothetical protein